MRVVVPLWLKKKASACLQLLACVVALPCSDALAATSIPLTVNMSEVVTVTGTPRVAVDVGGTTKYATYTGGSGTSALTFTLSPDIGNVDMDGIALISPLELNGGTIHDLIGNNATLTFTPPNTSGIKVNYPSLGLDFVADADGRYTLNGTAYNDLASFLTAAGGSFTRASIGTYYDSAGVLQTAASGAVRFDYDPVTHAPRGLLVEDARTNLLKYSADFTAANWSKTSASMTGAAGVAPDGTTTASLLTASSIGVNTGFMAQNVTGSFSTFTFSIYAKAAGTARLKFQPNTKIDGVFAGFTTQYELSTGIPAVGTPYGGKITSISASMQSVGNGWYRCSTTFTVSGTAFDTTINSWVFPYISSGDPVGSNVLVWGAQLEVNGFASSYIPTAAAAVTRAADVLSVPVGSWFTSSVGSLYADYKSAAPFGLSTRAASLASSGSINVFQLADSTSGYVLGQKSSAGVITNAVGPSYVSGTAYKAVGAFDTNGTYLGLNGSLYTAVGAGVPVGVAGLHVGHQNSQFQLNGWLQKVKYYPVRVPNAQLMLLTQ